MPTPPRLFPPTPSTVEPHALPPSAQALPPLDAPNTLDARLAQVVALYRRGDGAGALALCHALQQEALALPDPERPSATAHIGYWAGRCARRTEDLAAALRHLYDGLAASRAAGLAQLECLVLSELARVLSVVGDNEQALQEADAALQRAHGLRDPLAECAAHEAMGTIAWVTGDWLRGLAAYRSALPLAEACGSLELQALATLGMAATEEGLADIATDEGRPEDALKHGRRSLELQRAAGALAARLGDQHLAMYSELNQGCSLFSLHEYAAATAVFERCMAEPRYRSIHGNALTMLGRIALAQGHHQAALIHLQDALQLLEKEAKTFPMLSVLNSLVDAHEALGDYKTALAYLRRYHRLHTRNASEKALSRARAMTVRYDTELAQAVAEAQRARADQLELNNATLVDNARELTRASLEDPLTGIANRRRFDQALQAQAQPGGVIAPCSVALLDIDHFKQVNDHFSHQMGDRVLKRLGQILSHTCRRDELVARYGGEEFVVLMQGAERAVAPLVCERIRDAVATENWSLLAPGLAVTVSIGIAYHDEIPPDMESPQLAALMGLADARLYTAKHGGRNQVCDQGGRVERPGPTLA